MAAKWARVLLEHEILTCSAVVFLGYATTLEYLTNVLLKADSKPEAYLVNPSTWVDINNKASDFLAAAGVTPELHIQAKAKDFMAEVRRLVTIELISQLVRDRVPTMLDTFGLSEEPDAHRATRQVGSVLKQVSPERLQGALVNMLPHLKSTRKYVSLRKTDELHRLLRLLSIFELAGHRVQPVQDGPGLLEVTTPGAAKSLPLWAICLTPDVLAEQERIKWLTRFNEDQEFRETTGCDRAREIAVLVSGGTGEVKETPYFDICRGESPGGVRHRVPRVKWIVDHHLHSLITPHDVAATKDQVSRYLSQRLNGGGKRDEGSMHHSR